MRTSGNSSAPSGCLQTYEFTLIRHIANSTFLAHGPGQPLKLNFFSFLRYYLKIKTRASPLYLTFQQSLIIKVRNGPK